MSKLISVILLTLILFLLTGCSIIVDFYIRNFSESPKEITVKYRDAIYSPDIPSAPLEGKKNLSGFERMTERIPFQKHAADSISFSLAGNTICLLGMRHNTDFRFVQSIVVKDSLGVEEAQIFFSTEMEDEPNLTIKRRGLGGYTAWYDCH